MDFIDDARRAAQALGESLGELKAEIQPLGPDVEQQISGRARGGVHRSRELREWVQTDRTRSGEQPVPEQRPDPHHARQLRLGHAKADRPADRTDVGQHVADLILGPGCGRENEEDGGRGGLGDDDLGLGRRHGEAHSPGFAPRVCEPLRRIIGSDMSVSDFLHQARFRIDHRWAPRHMSPLIDGELARAERVRMERHTRECRDCRRLLGSLQRMVGALQALPAVGGGGRALQIAAAVRLRLDEPPAAE
jgi:hypothetical protein